MASRKRARLFISYKRVEPDHSVAREVFEALGQHHDVFIDQIIPVGVRWGERIEAEIRQADVFIAFLSADAICSEMVVAEISTAYQLTKSQGGRPVILPIRLAYRAPFPYPLSAYLDAINWASGRGPRIHLVSSPRSCMLFPGSLYLLVQCRLRAVCCKAVPRSRYLLRLPQPRWKCPKALWIPNPPCM